MSGTRTDTNMRLDPTRLARFFELAAGMDLQSGDAQINPELLDTMISVMTFAYINSEGTDRSSPFGKPVIRRVLFQMLFLRLGHGSSSTDLETAIRLGDEAVADPTSLTQEEQADIMDRLGYIKTSRYNINGLASDIHQAIDLGRRATALTAAQDPKRPSRLDNLGYSLSARYNATGSIEDLDRSIDVAKEALERIPQGDQERFKYINNLSARLTKRYQRTSQPEDQSEAIRLSYDAVEITEPRSALRGITLLNLASLLAVQFDRTGFRRDLEEALRVGRLARSAFPVGYEERGVMLHSLAGLLEQRYGITHVPKDLKEAIQLSEEAVAETPSGNPNRGIFVRSRVTMLKDYFSHTDTLNDLGHAITAVEEALAESPEGHPFHYFYLNHAASLVVVRFLRSQALTDWTYFLMLLISTIIATPEEKRSQKFRDEEYRTQTTKKLLSQVGRFTAAMSQETVDSIASRVLQTLHEEYKKRSETMGFMEAVADIVNGCVDVRLDVYGDNMDSVKAESMEILSQGESFGLTSMRFRFRLLNYRVKVPGDDDDDNGEPPKDASPIDGGESSKPQYEVLQDLSKMHENRFSRTRVVEDLDKAIHCSKAVLDTAPEDYHSLYSAVVKRLAHLWELRYQSLADLESLNKAIHYAELTLSNHAEDEQGRSGSLNNLASLLRWRFVQTASQADLDKSTKLAESALALISADSSPQRATILFTLAMALKSRYQRTGDVKDLDKCIKSAEESIGYIGKTSKIGTKDEDSSCSMFVNFGLIMRLSYQRTHALGDLDKAVEVTRDALKFKSLRPTQRIMVLSNLGLILGDKYKRTKSLDDLDESIACIKEALEIATAQGVSAAAVREGILINLGNALVENYHRRGTSEDLDDAIRYGAEAVRISRGGHMAGAGRNDLSTMLLSRCQRNSNLQDLDEAIRHAEDAVKLTAVDHPAQVVFLRQLGSALVVKMDMQPSDDTLQRCIQAHTDAWSCEMALPSQRIYAAWQAGRYLVRATRYNEAADMFEDAVKLVPNLSPRWIQRSDHQHRLTSFAGLAADAALTSLRAGRDPSHALQLLELGRGVMMGMLMDNRCEIPASQNDNEYPELLRKFNLLRMKAEGADVTGPGKNHQLHGNTNPRETVEEMESMLEDIRRLPGYEDFLLPPKPESLMAMAADGPIVIVSTSATVDPGVAIIIRASGISSLQLPKLTHMETAERMDDMVKNILKGSLKSFSGRNQKMCTLLLWLWEVAAEPILAELGFLRNDTPALHLPHVRWIGVGLLSRAPFHAAGDNSPGSVSNVMSRVISSYVPTLRALAFANERKPKRYLTRRREANLLVVLMPETPGAAPLSSVEEESHDTLKTAATASIQGIMLKLPTAAAVLEQLPSNNIVHFACHGVSDRADPSESHLKLSDANLTVQQILRNHAAAPDLAFLSACSTAQSHDIQLVDESINIASSFQMVGFRHVVGTLWTTADVTCGEIAHEFYGQLFAEDESEWDGTWKVSEALHFAVSTVRDKEYDFPLLWAPFVVFGG